MKIKSAAMTPRTTLVVFIAAVVLIGGVITLPFIVLHNTSASAFEAR